MLGYAVRVEVVAANRSMMEVVASSWSNLQRMWHVIPGLQRRLHESSIIQVINFEGDRYEKRGHSNRLACLERALRIMCEARRLDYRSNGLHRGWTTIDGQIPWESQSLKEAVMADDDHPRPNAHSESLGDFGKLFIP